MSAQIINLSERRRLRRSVAHTIGTGAAAIHLLNAPSAMEERPHLAHDEQLRLLDLRKDRSTR